jgi:hypothetical protein
MKNRRPANPQAQTGLVAGLETWSNSWQVESAAVKCCWQAYRLALAAAGHRKRMIADTSLDSCYASLLMHAANTSKLYCTVK